MTADSSVGSDPRQFHPTSRPLFWSLFLRDRSSNSRNKIHPHIILGRGRRTPRKIMIRIIRADLPPPLWCRYRRSVAGDAERTERSGMSRSCPDVPWTDRMEEAGEGVSSTHGESLLLLCLFLHPGSPGPIPETGLHECACARSLSEWISVDTGINHPPPRGGITSEFVAFSDFSWRTSGSQA